MEREKSQRSLAEARPTQTQLNRYGGDALEEKMRNYFGPERRIKKKARIDAVKALNLKPGEWVTNGETIFRLHVTDLDARKMDFVRLSRATAEQIEERERIEAEQARRRAAFHEECSRPEHKIASRLASTDTAQWFRLELNQLDHIARILDTVSA